MRAIPGIERFGGVTLGELEASGPRSLQTRWRAAPPQVRARYGEISIGEILDRYAGGERGGQAARQ